MKQTSAVLRRFVRHGAQTRPNGSSTWSRSPGLYVRIQVPESSPRHCVAPHLTTLSFLLKLGALGVASRCVIVVSPCYRVANDYLDGQMHRVDHRRRDFSFPDAVSRGLTRSS